jgi:hypothetical protein
MRGTSRTCIVRSGGAQVGCRRLAAELGLECKETAFREHEVNEQTPPKLMEAMAEVRRPQFITGNYATAKALMDELILSAEEKVRFFGRVAECALPSLSRIYAAVNTYDGPNTIFGRAITAHISSRRPVPPKPSKYEDDEGRTRFSFRKWYRWREKHPLGEIIAADGSLGRALDKPLKGIDSTERLIRLLLTTPKPPKDRKITAPSRGAASRWDPFRLT